MEMKVYDLSNVDEYNEFSSSPTDEQIFVANSKTPHNGIMEFAKYAEEMNPECEVVVTLWEETGFCEYEDTVYLRHKKGE